LTRLVPFLYPTLRGYRRPLADGLFHLLRSQDLRHFTTKSEKSRSKISRIFDLSSPRFFTRCFAAALWITVGLSSYTLSLTTDAISEQKAKAFLSFFSFHVFLPKARSGADAFWTNRMLNRLKQGHYGTEEACRRACEEGGRFFNDIPAFFFAVFITAAHDFWLDFCLRRPLRDWRILLSWQQRVAIKSWLAWTKRTGSYITTIRFKVERISLAWGRGGCKDRRRATGREELLVMDAVDAMYAVVAVDAVGAQFVVLWSLETPRMKRTAGWRTWNGEIVLSSLLPSPCRLIKPG
jgi:hypothetical protein